MCTSKTGWKDRDCRRCNGTGEDYIDRQGIAVEAAMEDAVKREEAIEHAKKLSAELNNHCEAHDIAVATFIGAVGVVHIDVNLEEAIGPTSTGAAIAIAWDNFAASIVATGGKLEERRGVNNG